MIYYLIGNSKHKPRFERLKRSIALKGNIVLTPDFYPKSSIKDANMTYKNEDVLWEVSQKKIDLADVVIVISDRDEVFDNEVNDAIEYSKRIKKPILYENEHKI